MKSTFYLLLLTLFAVSCTGKKQASDAEQSANIVFDSIALQQKIKLLPHEADSLPYATINIHFTYPVSFRSQDELRNLQSVFYDKVFGENFADAPNAGSVVNEFVENYTDIYREGVSEFNEMTSPEEEEYRYNRFTYYKSVSNKIEYENEALVSFSTYTEDFEGGAHGAYLQYNVTIDLYTQKIMHETDVFASGYKEPLAQILREKLLEVMKEKTKDFDIDVNADYRTFFNEFDNIYPNGNFLLDESGIHYTYNIYEIAAYASGTFNVFLPYGVVENLLKPHILSEYIARKN